MSSSPFSEKHPQATADASLGQSRDSARDQLNENSPDVVRIEAIASHLTSITRTILFVSIFFLGYSFGLDAVLRGVYQTYAIASYDNHSLLSTVNVIRTVFAAAAQPKLADAFGRIEMLCL